MKRQNGGGSCLAGQANREGGGGPSALTQGEGVQRAVGPLPGMSKIQPLPCPAGRTCRPWASHRGELLWIWLGGGSCSSVGSDDLSSLLALSGEKDPSSWMLEESSSSAGGPGQSGRLEIQPGEGPEPAQHARARAVIWSLTQRALLVLPVSYL